VQCEIEGEQICSLEDFHVAISRVLGFGPYYGKNLGALWDRLSSDVEHPVTLIWKNASASKQHMGEAFDAGVAVLKRVEAQDADWKFADRFTLVLR
jgi:ribonuclease inhibitor